MPVAHILDVQPNATPGTADFLFDTVCTGVADPNGFDINGNDGINISGGIGTTTVSVDFPSGVASADPWSFNSAVAGLTFVGGATISDDSGSVS